MHLCLCVGLCVCVVFLCVFVGVSAFSLVCLSLSRGQSGKLCEGSACLCVCECLWGPCVGVSMTVCVSVSVRVVLYRVCLW